MASSKQAKIFFLHDVVLVAISVCVTIALVETGLLVKTFMLLDGVEFLGSFIAGVFFTSLFTTVPAIIALGEIARTHAIIQVAFFGALGAVVGDLIIFRFIRDRFAEHLIELVNHQTVGKRLRALLRMKFFRILSFFVGGLIIASPLPDELGISLLSLSKIKTSWFIPLSFAFNFAGIVLIGLAAQAL
ncbi:MAG: hypothetical protein JWN18_591 [Parcubacteria group bacterium]|nr:hypothetical protein [Parcubacteria group bacterium]